VVAVIDPASRHATASVAGVRMRCPPIRFRRPGSGCPVSGHLGSSRGSGGRPSAVHPSSCLLSTRPLSSRLVSAPSGRVRLLHAQAVALGPDRAGRTTLTTGTGPGPGGCRAVDGSIDDRGGRDAGGAAQVALVSRRSVADPGRRVGCGPRRPRLPAARPGRPGRRPEERPSPAAARWAPEQATARGGRIRRVAAVLGLGARPRWVVVAEPDARLGSPGGARGGAGGDGRAAPARPRLAASVPGLLPAAL
jgi:hypothetical protein